MRGSTIRLLIISILLGTQILAFLPAKGQDTSEQPEKVREDVLQISARKFDESVVEKFRNDPDYQYHVVEKEGLTWWDRILLILWNIFRQIIYLVTGTHIGRIVFYLLCFALILFAIIKLFNIDVKGVFFHSSETAKAPINFHEENIHEISFEDRIQEAFQQGDYRECVRLTFLYALKKLSDQQIIAWKAGKTNDEYWRELSQHPARMSWQELRLYFDYTWYGHFDVDQPTYFQIKKIFEEFNQKLT